VCQDQSREGAWPLGVGSSIGHGCVSDVPHSGEFDDTTHGFGLKIVICVDTRIEAARTDPNVAQEGR